MLNPVVFKGSLTPRSARGDWQTPPALARAVVDRLAAEIRPAVVLEPTCGAGAFLAAARAVFGGARSVGYELDGAHLAAARAALGPGVELHAADAFRVNWEAVVAALPSPVLALGNPPWVTASRLATLGVPNRPTHGPTAWGGLASRTGRADFDVAEWMVLRLLDAGRSRAGFTLAMLVKASVARRVFAGLAARGWPYRGTTYAINARTHFGAAVAAVLLVVARADAPAVRWPAYDALDARAPTRSWGLEEGEVVRDADAAEATAALALPGGGAWRSGVKHDCAAVLELTCVDGQLVNGLGEVVEVEPARLYPLVKGADVPSWPANAGRRALLLPHATLDGDEAALRAEAPRAWAYLDRHRARFAARRSGVYRGRSPFAVFGVGPYTFAPDKVVVSGLARTVTACACGPVGGRPVLVDDTCYVRDCATPDEAQHLARAFAEERVRTFFDARVFPDAKRPVTKALLQRLR